MDFKEKTAKAAAKYFLEGFNCAESALLALTDFKKIDCNYIPKIASGFGGGVGRYGEICGALTGSIMALGLLHGRKRSQARDSNAKEKIYKMVEDYLNGFEKKFGSLRCVELTGCDLKTPEGLKKARDNDIHKKICTGLVEYAAEHAAGLLK